MRIEKGKSAVVVHLRPEPGDRKLRKMQVTVAGDASPLKLKIGEAGELIFSRRAIDTLFGRGAVDYDQIVRVFAPHAWRDYEYVTLKCETCRKDPDRCGAVITTEVSNGCCRYEAIEE
jgi:hypothetical protein